MTGVPYRHRNVSTVREDLRVRSFTPGDSGCIASLVGISRDKYAMVMRQLLQIGQRHGSLVTLYLPPAEILERVELESVKPRYLDNSGQVLNWSNLEARVREARAKMEEDTRWADDGERTPDPTTLDELNRRLPGIEKVGMADEIEVISREALTPPDIEKEFFELVQRKSPLLRFGKTITVGTIKNPASGLTRDEQELVIDALNFTGRSRDDIREHLIKVLEVVVVFHQGRPIAFGAGNEINFQNNGTSEQLEYLVGTMVREGHYGRGLQTVVNGLFLTKRKKILRRSPRIMMRSRAVGTIDGFKKYFSDVNYHLQTEAEHRRAAEFSRFMSGECDNEGVVRNAYDIPPHDPERDRKILEALKIKSPRKYNWVTTAIAGLGEKDARIFQGKLSYWKKIKIWLAINLVFRIKNFRFERKEICRSEVE